jgi:osmotically-inducible protein OsmY
MKKLFTVIALSSFALVSADQYNQQPSTQYGQQPSTQYGQQSSTQYGQQPSTQYGQQQTYQTQQKSGSQKTVSDQEIHKEIHNELRPGWFSKGFPNVSFDVNNVNVILRGSVDSLENKNKIEKGVREIEGVRQVNNQITIAKETKDQDTYSDSQLIDSEKKYPRDSAATPQDRQLNAKIRDKISNGWFTKDYETVVLKTANGIVIITGTVDKPEDAQKVSDKIKDIAGIRSVNNQLSVKNK